MEGAFGPLQAEKAADGGLQVTLELQAGPSKAPGET